MHKERFSATHLFALLGAGLIVSLLLVAAYAGATGAEAAPNPQDATESYPVHTVTVTGVGRASGSPDVAYLRIGVHMTGENVGSAVTQVNATMSDVRDALVGSGIAAEDLQTTGFNVWSDERYDAQGAPTGERVYRAENMLQITVRDVAQLESVINAGLDAGATNVYGMSFGMDDTAALSQEARLAAIEDARTRATELAEGLGLELGEPIIVQETFGTGGVALEAAGRGGGGGVVIEEGQLAVSVQVEITFRVAP